MIQREAIACKVIDVYCANSILVQGKCRVTGEKSMIESIDEYNFRDVNTYTMQFTLLTRSVSQFCLVIHCGNGALINASKTVDKFKRIKLRIIYGKLN